MDIIFIIIVAIIGIVALCIIIKEIRIIRVLLEIPSGGNKSYNDKLNKIDEEIKSAFTLALVASRGDREKVWKDKLNQLVGERKEIIETRRKHFYIRPEYLKNNNKRPE